MACFDDFISLEELCEVPTPTSGYYLNQIGITLTEIEQIITKDFTSVQDFVTKKSQFAIDKVVGEIYNHLSPQFRADSILSGARIGYEQAQKELVSQAGFVGMEVTLYNQSSFLDFVISDISLFIDSTATVPVLIYDLSQGKLLQTIQISTTAGQISRSYEKAVVYAPRNSLHLWIGYDGTGIDAYKVNTHSGCRDCSGSIFRKRFVQAEGAGISSPFTESELTNLNHTGGLSFNYSVNCNHRDWLCTHRNILGIPFLYKTGIEICHHALLAAPNQRTMAITTFNTEMMEKKLAYFQREYDREMENLMRNMSVPQDQNCFQCEKRIQSITMLP